MSSAKVVIATVAITVALSGCGVASKPEAGSAQAATKAKSTYNDPRTEHVECLAADHIAYTELTLGDNYPSIQVGTRPSGPTIEFTATAGQAQGLAIQGLVQGAEVIGAALVYPNQAPDGLMAKVEACMAEGVTG